METIELLGHITESGSVEVEGVTTLRPGTQVKVIIIERDSPESTWGSQVLDLLDQLDFSEWETMDIPDVVEWVKAQRCGSNAGRC